MAKKNFSMKAVLVLTTEENSIKAKELAKALLKNRVAACVSLNKAQSIYWWQGEMQLSDEVQLLIKTVDSKLDELMNHINNLHSYEVPEIIYWQASTNDAYGEWMESSFSPINHIAMEG